MKKLVPSQQTSEFHHLLKDRERGIERKGGREREREKGREERRKKEKSLSLASVIS